MVWRGPWDGPWDGGWDGGEAPGGPTFADMAAVLPGSASVQASAATGQAEPGPVSLPSTLRRRLRALVQALPPWTWVPVPQPELAPMRVSISARLSGGSTVVAAPSLVASLAARVAGAGHVEAAASLAHVAAARISAGAAAVATAETTDRHAQAKAEDDDIVWLLAA